MAKFWISKTNIVESNSGYTSFGTDAIKANAYYVASLNPATTYIGANEGGDGMKIASTGQTDFYINEVSKYKVDSSGGANT